MAKTWPGMNFRELMRSLAEAVIEAIPQRRAAMVGTLGFHIQSLTHPDLRERSLAETQEIYRRMAVGTLELIGADKLPMPAELLIPALHALIDGLVLHRVLTPELVPDEVIFAAFGALAAGAADREPDEASLR
jgi:hypothetical protein